MNMTEINSNVASTTALLSACLMQPQLSGWTCAIPPDDARPKSRLAGQHRSEPSLAEKKTRADGGSTWKGTAYRLAASNVNAFNRNRVSLGPGSCYPAVKWPPVEPSNFQMQHWRPEPLTHSNPRPQAALLVIQHPRRALWPTVRLGRRRSH